VEVFGAAGGAGGAGALDVRIGAVGAGLGTRTGVSLIRALASK
jgi:hypothetical protein